MYYPSVTAIKADGTYAAPTEKDVTEDPYTRMKPVTGLSWSGAIAQWTGKDYFTENQAYKLDLYVVTGSGYQFVKSFQVAGNVTQANFRSAFTAQRSYAFTVTGHRRYVAQRDLRSARLHLLGDEPDVYVLEQAFDRVG